MGRMTQDNIVDIDLGKEGRANKVSRQQVQAGNCKFIIRLYRFAHHHILFSVNCIANCLMYLWKFPGITEAQGRRCFLPSKSRTKESDG